MVPRLPFDRHLLVSALVSLVLANLGLSEIIVVLSPVIVILYPVAMTLVVVTLIDVAAPGHLRAAYLWPVAVSTVLAVLSALPSLGEERVSALLARTGLWNDSTGWIPPALIALGIGIVLDIRSGAWSTPAPEEPSSAKVGYPRWRPRRSFSPLCSVRHALTQAPRVSELLTPQELPALPLAWSHESHSCPRIP